MNTSYIVSQILFIMSCCYIQDINLRFVIKNIYNNNKPMILIRHNLSEFFMEYTFETPVGSKHLSIH